MQHPALTAAIAQLRFQLNTEGITFTVAANHLNSAVSQTPDYQMARQIKSTNTFQRGGRNNHSGGCGGRHFNSNGCGGCGHGRGGRGSSNNSNTQAKPNSSGYYPPAEWNKLSFEERDKVHKERKNKPTLSATPKQNLGEVSVEHVTAIIGAMQQAQATNEDSTADAGDTISNLTNTGNAFGGKANSKKVRIE